MTILWLTSAEQDLEALTDFIAEDNPSIALHIFSKIRLSIKKLKTHPYLGRVGRVKRTIELVVPNLPFIVVYSTSKKIRILAILHASRKWPKDFD